MRTKNGPADDGDVAVLDRDDDVLDLEHGAKRERRHTFILFPALLLVSFLMGYMLPKQVNGAHARFVQFKGIKGRYFKGDETRDFIVAVPFSAPLFYHVYGLPW